MKLSKGMEQYIRDDLTNSELRSRYSDEDLSALISKAIEAVQDDEYMETIINNKTFSTWARERPMCQWVGAREWVMDFENNSNKV